jgi:hypothetical protein
VASGLENENSLHSERQELLEHLEDVGIQILREKQRLQGRAVLLHLLVMLKQKESFLSQNSP